MRQGKPCLVQEKRERVCESDEEDNDSFLVFEESKHFIFLSKRFFLKTFQYSTVIVRRI